MRDEEIKTAVDRFLKNIAHSAQREIEKALRDAVASGRLKDGDNPSAQVTLTSDKVGLNVTIHKRLEF